MRKAHDPLLDKRSEEEVEMSEKKELTLETLNESLGKIAEKVEAIEVKQESFTQPLGESLTNEQPGEVEQLKGKVAELEQERPLLKRQGTEEFVRGFEENDIADDGLGQRIFGAIRKAGYDIRAPEGVAEVVENHKGEAEMPEPPFLHIISEPREGYFPFGDGKYARLVEVV